MRRALPAMAALAAGVLVLGGALGSGCAGRATHAPPGTGQPQRRGALEARIRELRGEIQSNATALGLPRTDGAGFAPEPGAADAAATDPMPRSPEPMARAGRCERVCDLAEAICQDADEICRIADELADDDSRRACDDSQNSCRAAQQRCKGCR